MQRNFNPIDFGGFNWTNDGTQYGWYEWDFIEGHKQARKARDTEVKALRKAGQTVTVYSMPNQHITRGGIGSGHPEVDFFVTGYGFNTF